MPSKEKQLFKMTSKFGDGVVNLLCYGSNQSNFNEPTMKIEQIEIKDIGGIPYLKLDNLDPQMNIICGENGVGKTNILDIIAAFTESSPYAKLKMRHGTCRGEAEIKSDIGGSRVVVESNFNESKGDTDYTCKIKKNAKSIMYFRVNRVFEYTLLRSVESENRYNSGYYNSFDGVKIDNIKTWFVHRVLFGALGYLSDTDKANIELAKHCFDMLNGTVTFHSVTKNFDIYVDTYDGVIPYEYLSSGFKSCITIFLGIIKEIEKRFGDCVSAQYFDGIILIDELELHLHPHWQGVICNRLKDIFPNVQFFITTHSPHIIQGAKKEEVIALQKIFAFNPTEYGTVEGATYAVDRRDLPSSSEYGFQGWTVEEILTDVMGLGGTRGEEYYRYIKQFDFALDENNKEMAFEAFTELEKMLHPNSYERKILQLQMTTLG